MTPLGSEDGSIERVKLSRLSSVLSSAIETLNMAKVSPVENVISNGPVPKSIPAHIDINISHWH